MDLEAISAEATQDERILAALAHASVVLPFWGLIGATVIWATQREKSRLVGFQAVQGMAYQLVLVLSGAVCIACYFCSFFGTFFGSFALMPIGLLAPGGEDGGAVIGILLGMIVTFIPFLVAGVSLLVAVAFVIYGFYGAVRILQGHAFRYIIIGRRLERYLSQKKAPA